MTDGRAPRRRWIRWTIIGLIVAGLVTWLKLESPTIRRSRALRIGQTKAAVIDVMGETKIVEISDGDGTLVMQFASESEVCQFRFQTSLMWRLLEAGLPYAFLRVQYPVEVHAQNGRVVYIRRGDERVSN
jgi:hypothetical protein